MGAIGCDDVALGCCTLVVTMVLVGGLAVVMVVFSASW